MSPFELLVAFIMMHFLCDYPLQGDFIGKFKNRYNHRSLGHFFFKNDDEIAYRGLCDHILSANPIQRCNKLKEEHYINIGVPWWHLMAAHSFIQGGGVFIITGSLLLGLMETIFHFIIDCLKCENKINIHTDQALHIWCKVVWTYLWVIYASN